MEPYQRRVIDEKTELSFKVKRLEEYVQRPGFNLLDRHERADMMAQLRAMQEYSTILGRRINRFEVPDDVNI